MANKRIEGGLDTPTRLQKTWEEVLAQSKYPTVAEFARMARIAYATLAHRYPEMANLVRRRRDLKRKPRKLSPATEPKVKALAAAQKQIEALQAELRESRNRINEVTRERDQLVQQASKAERYAAENRHLRGAVSALMRELQLKAVPTEQLARLRAQIERGLVVVDTHNDEVPWRFRAEKAERRVEEMQRLVSAKDVQLRALQQVLDGLYAAGPGITETEAGKALQAALKRAQKAEEQVQKLRLGLFAKKVVRLRDKVRGLARKRAVRGPIQ